MRCSIFIGIILLGVLFTGCGRKTVYQYTEGKIYGTFYHISYAAPEDLQKDIRFEMERVNRSLSMFNPQSVIAKLNGNESDRTDELFDVMFGKALEVNRSTDGAFDITVAPLVNAWGFGYEQENFPDSARIDSLLELVGMDKLVWSDGKLQKQHPAMELDASSIAKGLGVDLVADYFDRKGIADYMVEIGGEVRVKGKSSKDRPWRIGIDRPDDDVTAQGRDLQMVVELSQGALATSGNYRNFYVHEGKKYGHTISPMTGYPVQTEILSSSVYADSCMEADAYATAFMVIGLEKAKQIIQEHPQLEACFIYQEDRNLRTWMSEGFKKKVVTAGD